MLVLYNEGDVKIFHFKRIFTPLSFYKYTDYGKVNKTYIRYFYQWE